MHCLPSSIYESSPCITTDRCTVAQLLHIHPASEESTRTPVILHIVFFFESHNTIGLLTSSPLLFDIRCERILFKETSRPQCRAERDVVHSSGQRVQSASSMKSSVTQCAESVCTAISCGGEATCVSHVQPALTRHSNHYPAAFD